MIKGNSKTLLYIYFLTALGEDLDEIVSYIYYRETLSIEILGKGLALLYYEDIKSSKPWKGLVL